MLDQQQTQTILEGKPLNANPKAFISLDLFPGGKTICLSADDNSLIDYEITCYSQALQRAEALYRSVRFAGQVSRFLSWMFHQPAHLMNASDIIEGAITAYSSSGVKSVSINHLVASEIRFCDFNFGFNPLNDKGWNQWINIAALMLLGVELPPVDLLQINGTYIVRDGHNRISVTNALGKDRITACVTHLKHQSQGTYRNANV